MTSMLQQPSASQRSHSDLLKQVTSYFKMSCW